MHFFDLRPVQVRAMIHLAGWASDSPMIGVLEDSLQSELLEAAIQLERLGLARVETGWLGSRWWHLTDRGHRIRKGWNV
jgi:hypothetical protein